MGERLDFINQYIQKHASNASSSPFFSAIMKGCTLKVTCLKRLVELKLTSNIKCYSYIGSIIKDAGKMFSSLCTATGRT